MDIPSIKNDEFGFKDKVKRKEFDDKKKKKNNDEDWVLKESFSRKRDESDVILEIKCLFCHSIFSPSTGNSSLRRHTMVCPKKPIEEKK